MDLSVASSLHGNKITADKDLQQTSMFVLVTTEITKIHGLYHWKDGMAYFKTHVELMLKRCTEQMIQK